MSQEKKVQFLGTISWQELKLYLKNVSVTEKKKMDGMGTMDKSSSGVVSIFSGETLTNR
jgi:hypothetical protein